MEWILGIDTSSTELGIGLVRDGESVAGYSRYVRGSHAEHIQAAVDFLLAENRVCPEQIRNVAVTVGPGSFTGLRIGIAFVKGFCFMRDARVLPVSSLQSVAAAYQFRCSRPLVVAFDARRDQVFWARFRTHEHRMLRETEDAVAPVEGFLSSLQQEDIVITDRLGNLRSTVFQSLRNRTDVSTVEETTLLRGLGCARAAALMTDGPAWVTALELEPRYLSPSYVKSPGLPGKRCQS